MKILITGHKGFIGRHFWETFQKQGEHELIGIDLKGCTYKPENRLDRDVSPRDCRDWFKDVTQQFDLVIHCAAIVGGRMTIDNEPLRVATDLSVDAEMFNWAVRTKQKKVVYFSSCAAYPTILQDEGLIGKEEMLNLNNHVIGMPDKTYGWAKVTGELLAEFARKQGVEVYVVRPYSSYGPDQDLDYPFPTWLKHVKEKADPFIIWGDGEQTRDWIHINDLINAILTMIEKGTQGPVNLCTGKGTTMNEFVKKLIDIANEKGYDYHPEIQNDLSKPTGPRFRVGDPTKMNEFYTADITIEQGINECL